MVNMVLHGSHQYSPVMLAYIYQHHGSSGLYLVNGNFMGFDSDLIEDSMDLIGISVRGSTFIKI